LFSVLFLANWSTYQFLPAVCYSDSVKIPAATSLIRITTYLFLEYKSSHHWHLTIYIQTWQLWIMFSKQKLNPLFLLSLKNSVTIMLPLCNSPEVFEAYNEVKSLWKKAFIIWTRNDHEARETTQIWVVSLWLQQKLEIGTRLSLTHTRTHTRTHARLHAHMHSLNQY